MEAYRAIFLILLVFSYLVFINIIYSFISVDSISNSETISGEDSGTKLTINSNSRVTALIERPRFYGTIRESGGDSFVYLLDVKIFKLPLYKENIPLWYAHIAFLLSWSVVFIYLRGSEKIGNLPPTEKTKNLFDFKDIPKNPEEALHKVSVLHNFGGFCTKKLGDK